jgi:hypothetical protein
MDNELPERINAIKSISYDVSEIVADIRLQKGDNTYEVVVSDVLDWIEDVVDNDFVDTQNEIIYQDENGNEVDA